MRCWHVAKSLGAPPAAGDRWYALFTAPGECPLRFYQPNPPFHNLMVTGWLSILNCCMAVPIIKYALAAHASTS